MRFLLLLFLTFANANFGASQDEMDLFDLGNDFRWILPRKIIQTIDILTISKSFFINKKVDLSVNKIHFNIVRTLTQIYTERNSFFWNRRHDLGPSSLYKYFCPETKMSKSSWKSLITVEEVNANFYDYLGVPPDAEKKAINKQYRTLAKVKLVPGPASRWSLTDRYLL